jgi:hypothetical protein
MVLAMVAVYVIVAMQYSLWSLDIRDGLAGVWRTPNDFWTTYQSSAYLVTGKFSHIYSPVTGLVVFPGVTVLLAPVAALADVLGWRAGTPITAMWSPPLWLVAGPYMLVWSSLPVFACDRLARDWGWSRGRRMVLGVAQLLILVNVTLIWGHLEDAVAVGLLLFAVVSLRKAPAWKTALLLGLAIAVQPLSVLVVPAILARLGWSRAVRVFPLVILPSFIVLLVPFVAEPHALWHAIVDQPNYPSFNHRTPWTSISARLPDGGVAAGPFRAVAVAVTATAGAIAGRRWRSDVGLVWFVAAAFVVRLFSETVIADYYVWPALCVGLLIAGRRSTWALGLFAVGAVALSWFQQMHIWGVWGWWLVTTVPLTLVVVALYPFSHKGPTAGFEGAADLLQNDSIAGHPSDEVWVAHSS